MKKAIALIIVLLSGLAIPVVNVPFSTAQSVGNVIINVDGSVTGTNNIRQIDSTYTLTGNISGSIQVEKSNIVINGSGYTLNGNGNFGVLLNNAIYNPTISGSNVTIENLYITNVGDGILSNGGSNCTFYDNYVTGGHGGACILLSDCEYDNITFCSINGSMFTVGISMDSGSRYNTITENDIAGSVTVSSSVTANVDKNYWSNYSADYPNATEVDNSGIWNTPYVYSFVGNSTYLVDNHPLVKPVAIPLTSSRSTAPSVPEFPVWIILPIFMIATLLMAMVYSKKRRH
jgi:nitrous oxidase accessory protein NosD